METENGDIEREEQKTKVRKHKGKHDKPKPWDDESIDHWKIEKFDRSWNETGMLEVSSFSTLFPQYRGYYSIALLICLQLCVYIVFNK
jgi:ribosomal RNA assembly protein